MGDSKLMQQFGFSAADETTKQWDETQNSTAPTFSPYGISSGTQMPSNYLPGVLFITKPAETAGENILWGKLRFVKPFPKSVRYQPGMNRTPATRKKIRFWWCEAGGLSAAGKGLVLIQNTFHLLKSVHPAPVCSKKTSRQYGLPNRRHTRYGQRQLSVWANKWQRGDGHCNNPNPTMNFGLHVTKLSLPLKVLPPGDSVATAPLAQPHWYKSLQLTSSGIRYGTELKCPKASRPSIHITYICQCVSLWVAKSFLPYCCSDRAGTAPKVPRY